MDENMENMELEQMREQLALLRNKLREQEIINEKTVIQAVKSGVRSINRRGIIHSLIGILAVPFCCYVFYDMGLSDNFIVWTGIMLAVCAIATIYAHWGLNMVNISRHDIVKVGLHTMRLRKIYKSWYYISIPMLIVWGYFLYHEFAFLVNDTQQLKALLMCACVGGGIGGFIGIRMHFKTLHEADEVLEHIHDLTQDELK